MASPPKKPQTPAGRSRVRSGLDLPYQPGDAIPKPEVVERTGDSAWAQFNDLIDQQDAKFADTVPGMQQPFAASTQDPMFAPTRPIGLSAERNDASPDAIPATITLDVVMLEARKRNRVCPRPRRWLQVYEMLPNKHEVNGRQHPPPPMVGPVWNSEAPLAKRLCFREHLEWAERHGALIEVFAIMKSLTEEEWFHMDEA